MNLLYLLLHLALLLLLSNCPLSGESLASACALVHRADIRSTPGAIRGSLRGLTAPHCTASRPLRTFRSAESVRPRKTARFCRKAGGGTEASMRVGIVC